MFHLHAQLVAVAGSVGLPMAFGLGAGVPVAVERWVVGNERAIGSERRVGFAGGPVVGVAAVVAVAVAVVAVVVAVAADAVAGQVVAAVG